MKKPRSPRRPAALLCAPLVLATLAHAQPVPWPQPRPDSVVPASLRAVPNFQAPSATHCARPVGMREVPGYVQGQRHRMHPVSKHN